MSDFATFAAPRARKDHCCEWCGENIAVGEVHVQASGMSDGAHFRQRLHTECHAAVEFARGRCRSQHLADDWCEYCAPWLAEQRCGCVRVESNGGDTFEPVYSCLSLAGFVRAKQ